MYNLTPSAATFMWGTVPTWLPKPGLTDTCIDGFIGWLEHRRAVEKPRHGRDVLAFPDFMVHPPGAMQMPKKLTLFFRTLFLLGLSTGWTLAQQSSTDPSGPTVMANEQDLVGFGQSQKFGESTVIVKNVSYGQFEWPPADVGMPAGKASGVLVTVGVSFVGSDSWQSLLQNASIVDTQGKIWKLTATKIFGSINRFDGPIYRKQASSGSTDIVLLFECPQAVEPVALEWKGLKPFSLLSRR